MITNQQRDVMLFLERYMARSGGVAPTIKEIAAHRGNSLSGSCVQRMLLGLEARGFIRRLPYRARAIEIMRPVSRFEVMAWDDERKALRPHAPS